MNCGECSETLKDSDMNTYAITTKAPINGNIYVFLVDAESNRDARIKFVNSAPCYLTITHVKKVTIKR